MRASLTPSFDRRQYQRRFKDAESLQNQGKYGEAATLLRENLALSTQHLGVRHFATLNDQDSLSDCLHDLGEYAEAVALDRRTLQIRKENDERSQETLATQHSLANNLSQLGQYQESIALYRSILAHRKEVLGDSHNDTLETRHQLAYNLQKRGQNKEASQLNTQILEVREKKLARDDYDLIATRHNLATNLHARKTFDKARVLTNQNLVLLQGARPAADPQLLEVEKLQERIKLDILVLERSRKALREKEEADKRAEKVKLERRLQKQAEKALDQTLKVPEKPSKRKLSDPEGKRIEKPGKAETSSTKGEVPSVTVPPTPAVKTSPQAPPPTSAHVKKKADGKTGEDSRGNSTMVETPSKKDKSLSTTVLPIPAVNTSPQTPPTSNHRKKTEGDGTATPLPESSPKRKDRAKSNERKSHNEPKASDLQVPSTREQRSRSVGASSSEQGETIFQRTRVYTYSNLCDSRPCEGSLSDTTHTKSTSGWFGCLKDTQSLVAQGRKSSGKRVRIAILDTGIDLAHSQFGKLDDAHPEYGSPRDRVKRCVSFVDGQKADRDFSGHGTHSAALLLALAPKADIYVGGVVELKNDNVDPAIVAKAIMHATDDWKVKIITMSFGWSYHHPVVERAIKHATTKDVIMCAAASNNGAIKNVAFPASFPPVVCVHSASELGNPSSFTPTAQELSHNFTVLGENVRSTWPGEEREKARSGTSTATPILAAIMALVLEFMYQKQKKTSQDLRLETERGMTHLLQAMSKQERGYHLVQPWTVYDFKKERTRVESRILDIMEEKFPEG